MSKEPGDQMVRQRGPVAMLLLRGVICTLTLNVLVGCGGAAATPKPVPVKGKVIFRDKPLANARVTFYAKGAPMPAIGNTNEAGEFELSMYKQGDGALVGENKVTVTLLSDDSEAMTVPDPTAIAEGKAVYPKAEKRKEKDQAAGGPALPRMYSDPASSPINVTVRPGGEPDVKIELK